MPNKPKICFVSINSYHLLTKQKQYKFMGGAELQGLLICRELVRRGYDVSIVTLDHDPAELEENLPFRLIPTFGRKEGLPILKFWYPKLFKLWRGLRKSGADIYYLNNPGFMLMPIVMSARKDKSKVLLWGASDTNFDTNYKNLRMPYYRDKALYLWGLKRTDAFVVQNEIQQRTLKENFHKDSVIIHNGLPPTNGTIQTRENILWVGSIRKIKNPHHFLELARRMPNEKFVMVGGVPSHMKAKEHSFQKEILKDAQEIPNLDYKGFKPYDEVQKEFANAKVFVNTSSAEGFPNTFLQAWSRGIPTVSFQNVNPDQLVTRHKLGRVVKDLSEMVEAVNTVGSNESDYSPERIKSFFEENLTVEIMVDKMEKVFEKTWRE